LISNIPWTWKIHEFGLGPIEYLVKYRDGTKKGRAVIVMSNDKIYAPKGSAARMQILDKAKAMFEDSDIHINRKRLRLISTFNRATGDKVSWRG
jgi:hypothetical protein